MLAKCAADLVRLRSLLCRTNNSGSPSFIAFIPNRAQHTSTAQGSVSADGVPMNLIKELRKITSAGVVDCKNALLENNNNIELAITWLRKKGALKAATKAGRVAGEGLVTVSVSPNHSLGLLFEMNCETDFVSKGDSFTELTRRIGSTVFSSLKPSGNAITTPLALETLKSLKLANQTVSEAVTDLVAKVNENIQLRRALQVEMDPSKGLVCGYVHRIQGPEDSAITAGRIGCLVALESQAKDRTALAELGRKLAMHIVAFSPKYISTQDVPNEFIQKLEKDFEISQQSLREENAKFNAKKALEEFVLLDQDFSLAGYNKTVKDALEEQSNKLGSKITVKHFTRFEAGEGIEKVDTFAADVEKLTNKQ